MEDEPDQARLIKTLLESKVPAAVDVASSCAAARELLSSRRYDVITLDYQLPDANGLELLEAIRRLEEPPPVIMVTGHGDEQVAANAMGLGAFGYVVKDKRLNVLLVDAVKKALVHAAHEREGHDLLEQAIDAVADLVMVVDLDGRLLYWNGAVRRLLKYGDEELGSRKITDGRSGVDLERVVGGMKKVLDEGSGSFYEIDLIDRDGGRIPCEFSGALLRDEKGHPVAICGVGRDVRQRRLLEEDLRRSEQRYRAIVEDQAELICRLTADTLEFTFLNEAMCDYFGIRADRLLGDSILNLLPGEDGLRVSEDLRRVAAERQGSEMDEKTIMEDGSTRWQHWSARPVFDRDGNVIELQVVGRDITAQKKVEQELQESWETFRAAFKSAPNILAMTSMPDGELVDVNDAFLEVVGMPREEVIGRTAAELGFTPSPRSREELMRELSEKGGIFNLESDFSSRDGTLRSVLVSMMPMEIGDARYTLTSAIDISDRKKAEDALKRSEERFRSLVEHSHDIIAVVSPEGLIEFISPSVERILGFTPVEMVGKSAFEFSHPDAAPDAIAVHANALENPGSTLQRELRLKRKDGSWCHVDTIGSALVSGSTVLGTLLNCRDISDRKRAEEVARQGAARAGILATVSDEFARAGLDYTKTIEVISRSLAEQIGDVCVVLLVSEDGRFLEVEAIEHRDPAVREFAMDHALTGRWELGDGVFAQVISTGKPVTTRAFRPEQLAGWAVDRLAPYIEKYGINSTAIVPLRVEDRVIGTLVLSRDNPGQPYTPEDQALLQDLADRAGMAIGMARLHERVSQELEARLQKEKDLLAANTELKVFAHTVSHDLKGPIATMKLNMELLQQRRSELSEAESGDMLDAIMRNVDKCYALIEDLLTLAESGQIPTSVEEVDVSSAVRRVLDDDRVELERRLVRVEISEPLGAIRADRTHVYQVFSNLILNAVRHNVKDGLRIEVSRPEDAEGGTHRFLVRDDGEGIPEELLDKLFEPFVKGESGGTGIGLAIVDKIIRAYRGTIRAYNDDGACFEFTINDYPEP